MTPDIDYASRLTQISRRLELPKKLSREERERIETTISNASGNGELTDDQYRKISRSLREHA